MIVKRRRTRAKASRARGHAQREARASYMVVKLKDIN